MVVVGINTRQQLEKWIVLEPLIVTEPSIDGIKEIDLRSSLYFGVGLCNGGDFPHLSKGVPIDILAMILASELLSGKKNILIADTHAKTNGFRYNEIREVAAHYKNTLTKVIGNLGLEGWDIISASDIDSSQEYLSVFNSIDEPNDYFRRELTDMVWFSREKDVGLKLGWALKGSRNSDETSFDRRFREVFDESISFVYLVPGVTFNIRRPRAAPYFCDDKNSRILLEEGENAESKINNARVIFGEHGVCTYKNFLTDLLRLYTKVIEPLERGPIEPRIQYVLDRCLK